MAENKFSTNDFLTKEEIEKSLRAVQKADRLLCVIPAEDAKPARKDESGNRRE